MKPLRARSVVGVLGPILILTACSSGGSTGTASTPSNSPQALVSTGLKDLATGNYQDLCKYLALSPGQQCTTGSPGTFTVKGYSLGESSVQGDRALVVVRADQVCIFHASCTSNQDPRAGLPNGSVTFDQAWQAATSGQSLYTAAVERINGKWMIVALLKKA